MVLTFFDSLWVFFYFGILNTSIFFSLQKLASVKQFDYPLQYGPNAVSEAFVSPL